MGKRVVHVELPAKDADRAQKFWEAVGGWSISDSGMPGIDYRMFQEGDQGGAVYPTSGGAGPDRLLRERRHRRRRREVRELGGEADDKQPIPGTGWFAGCKDTEGNPFSLFQSDESVPMPEGAPGS